MVAVCNTASKKCTCAGGNISCSGYAELLQGHHDTVTGPTPG